MNDISTTKFIKMSFDKSEYHYCEEMDLSRPAILILGGENTNSTTGAWQYISHIRGALLTSNIESDIDIYSAYYKTRNRDVGIDRINLFKDKGHIIPPEFDIPNNALSLQYPNYLHQIYEFAFEPRMFNSCGGALSQKTVMRNFRKLIIFTHCHGAYVKSMMADRISCDAHAHYSPDDIKAFQKQTLVINHSPFAPLGNACFSEISFMSASDIGINLYNKFFTYMRENPQRFKPAFFAGALGNVMIVDKIKTEPTLEHGIGGIAGHGPNDNYLTPNGRKLFSLERNALICGARAAIKKSAIPTLNQLPNDNLAELSKAGKEIYAGALRGDR